MLLIWGSKYIKTNEKTLKYRCLICYNNSLEVCYYRKWFTFFFIPIFPYSSKEYYVECLECSNIYQFKGIEEVVSGDQAPEETAEETIITKETTEDKDLY